MATIKYVKTPDGTTHNIGGGGGTVVTYSISLGAVSSNAVPIILTGSDGTTDTVYVKGGGDATMSVSGDTMTITATSGQTITYTLSGSGTTTTYTITNTPSSGTASSVTIPAATTSSAGLMTDADKTKLDGIASGAEVNVQSDWNQTDSTADDYIKNKPTIPSIGDGTLTIQKNGTTIDTFTANQSSNTTVNVTVPTATSDLTNDSDFVSDASYVHTDNNFTNTLKNKLDGIQAGAEVNVQSNWTQSDSTADDYIKNKPTLATVATSGDYDDLTNKPTIPTVNDGTLTIQKNGSTIDTFTANQSGNTTVNVTVPTTASDIGAQEELVSGTNIKTINGNSILGSGNITTPDTDTTYSISEQDGTLTLTGSDSSTSSVGVVTDVEIAGTSVVVDGVADITATGVPHVNLTQAQYDALSDAEKNNGTIYFITDGQGTAEEIIGTGTLDTTAQTLIGAVNEINSKSVSMQATVLYSGTKVTSGNIQLTDNYANYDLLAIFLMTNTDYFVEYLFIDSSFNIGHNITFDHMVIAPGNYSSWIETTPVSPDKFYVASHYNNANWVLGVFRIVGIKFGLS